MTGAVTMKMISRTRTMSMNGIMLISASVVCVLPSRVVNAIGRAPFFSGGKQFHLKFVQLPAQIPDLIDEMVVRDQGRNCSKQTERRRDERIGNSGRDGTKR